MQQSMALDLDKLARNPHGSTDALTRAIERAEAMEFKGAGLRRCKGLLNTMQAKE